MPGSIISVDFSDLSNAGSSLDSTVSMASSNAQTAARRAGKKLDESFYFEDAFFEVQDTIFKVHKREFEESSPIFREIFAAATGEGLAPENPIRLQNTSTEQFKQLLEVMYHSYNQSERQARPKSTLRSSKLLPAAKLTTTQWISVLRLSTMWEMDLYRRTAIASLSEPLHNISPAKQLHLAMKYRVKAWFVPALHHLAQRPKPMGKEEYQLLGADCLLKVCQVRERFQCHCGSCSCLTNENVTLKHRRKSSSHEAGRAGRRDYDFLKDIQEVFAEDIARFSDE